MKNKIILALLVSLSACSKVGSFEMTKTKYRQECFGDTSVRCRSMMVDLNIAKLEAAIEVFEKSKGDIVACDGQRAYDEAIQLTKEKIDYFRDLKPNFFLRFVMPDKEVEFNPPPFEREREFSALQQSLSTTCNKTMAPISALDAKSVADNGKIDSNSETIPVSLNTVAGVLVREQLSGGQTAVTLNGKALFSGDDAQWQFPLRSFKLSSGREAILMASSGGRGNSCETLFFFLIADHSGMRFTPEFGTCSAQGEFVQVNDKIKITLPKMGGQSFVVFDGTTLTEDDKVINLQVSNDPSK